VTGRRADRLAMAGIAIAAVVVTWPLLANPHGLPPDNEDLGLDAFNYYDFAAAARQTVLRFGQFPLRSPWHGGGYPLYANPDDLTLTPTMLLVLAVGPWAAIKIDFVLTMIVGGVGMFLLTRRKMGYSLAAALFSATAFALGGFLMARWLRGWRPTTHAAWLPLIMYALWRGRWWRTATLAVPNSADSPLSRLRRQHQQANPCEGRRWWLALAAILVAWLFIDSKYVAVVMGWFLFTVGLLRLDEPDKVSGTSYAKHATPLPRPAWGYFGRLTVVWVFGAGLAAVKLVPMLSLVRGHLDVPPAAAGREPWRAAVLWAVIFAALGLTPLLGRLAGAVRTRRQGVVGIAVALAAVVLAVGFLAPPRRGMAPPAHFWLEEVTEALVSFGGWDRSEQGDPVPTQEQGYRFFAPVGVVVWLLWVIAIFVRPRETWKWAVLVGLLLFLELGRILPRVLGDSLRDQPLLGFMREPRRLLNFYLFFLLTLLAGRALDWHRSLQCGRALSVVLGVVAWVLLAGHTIYVGSETRRRLAYTVSAVLPPEPAWGPYRLLDRPGDRWRDRPGFLLRRNVGLIGWDLDFRDLRHAALRPSLLAAHDGSHRPNPDFAGMVWFHDAANQADLETFMPNLIVVHVDVRRPGVLRINQIGDADWRPSEGALVPDALLLSVRLDRVGEYDVRLRYVPKRLFIGFGVSALTALVGLLLLALALRRRRTRRQRCQVPFAGTARRVLRTKGT